MNNVISLSNSRVDFAASNDLLYSSRIPDMRLTAPVGESPSMVAKQTDKHYRSLVKAVSWRFTGSLDTFVLSFIITGSIKLAGSISLVELLTKILLFYAHERIWAAIRWGKA